MVTATRERELVIEMEPSRVETVVLSPKTKVLSPGTAGIQVPSSATPLQPANSRVRWLHQRTIGIVLAGFARKLLMVHELLFGPPFSEHDRVNVQIVRARHDSYISFYR